MISLSNCKSENFSGNASLPPSTTIRFRLQNDLRPRPMDVDFCPWFSHDAQIPEDRWSHELEKVDATHGQLLIRHDLAIPQSLELGCKLHRDARDEVTTTVATNVTHAAAHSVAWATTVVDATTTEAIVKFGCGDLGIGVCIALRA